MFNFFFFSQLCGYNISLKEIEQTEIKESFNNFCKFSFFIGKSVADFTIILSQSCQH